MNLVKTALTYVAVFSVGAVTSVSCFEPDLENPSFRCSPKNAVTDPDACPTDEVCCSDDPATTEGRLPNYNVPGTVNTKYGVPIFSGDNNSLSESGMCVKTGFATPLVATGCPVPCNPTWTAGEIADVCQGAFCCQVQELDPVLDCVMDPVTKKIRAVTGTDIGTPVTTWGAKHATNQDPNGTQCAIFASGGGGGAPNKAILDDCYDQLSVANQRGFCNAGCPCVEDRCELLNPDAVPKCGVPTG